MEQGPAGHGYLSYCLTTYLTVLRLHQEVMHLSLWSDCLLPNAEQDVLGACWE